MTPTQQLALWADKLRDMSANGLRYSRNIYDLENYRTIQEIAMEMLAMATGETMADMEPLREPVFSRPSPLSVGDAAIIDDDGHILLIQRADNHQWAMPGGMLAVGETPVAGVLREALEETGVTCVATKLVGVFDSRLHHGTGRHLYHFVFLCRPIKEIAVQQPTHANEILDCAWFAEDALPSELDSNHVTRIPVAFAVWRGERDAFFDHC